jgi:hypothetical protein
MLSIWRGVIQFSYPSSYQILLYEEEEIGDEGEGGRGNIRRLGINEMANRESKIKHFGGGGVEGTTFVDTKAIPTNNENEAGKLSSRRVANIPAQ